MIRIFTIFALSEEEYLKGLQKKHVKYKKFGVRICSVLRWPSAVNKRNFSFLGRSNFVSTCMTI
jgi:hypothetical protein